MDSRDYIRDYYESYDGDGRLRTRYGSVEFITTMHYVERYLQPGCRTIEIGAGTGRYSHALARRGYRVDAVELNNYRTPFAVGMNCRMACGFFEMNAKNATYVKIVIARFMITGHGE